MKTYTITHPQAQQAIWLAHTLHGKPSDVITARINASSCPRSLFVLASVLRAATKPGAIKGDNHG